MAITPRLELRQSQNLVMTPQLQQAIKLLQLSNLDLATYVEQELEKNPLLEQDESGTTEDQSPAAEAEAPDADDTSGGAVGAEATVPELTLSEDSASPESGDLPLDVDYDNVFNSDGPGDTPSDQQVGGGADGDAYLAAWSGSSGSGAALDDDRMGFEQVLSSAPSLKDYLTEQLQVSNLDAAERMIGLNLVDLVDDAGYLRGELVQVAERLGCDEAKVEQVLSAIQAFEPPGIMARDLGECLALQQKARDRLNPAMAALLQNLDLVARRDMGALKRLCGVDAEDIGDMISEIQALNPKPGLAFGSETIQLVVPDVFVRKKRQGGWIVELNTETLPRVLVNSRYYAEISENGRSGAEKTYISECLASANWLVKSLNQRAKTILKVAKELVKQQERFFTDGVEHLRPLNLRTIAEAIDMHESTVSRVTANKYMATSRGIFEMKYFFTSAIASAEGGDAYSAESVRHKIKELVEAEAVDAILSDDKIVDILRADGVDIARRTVAKYRDALRISSSVQRRRLKNTGPK